VRAIYDVALLAALVLGVFGQLLFKSGLMRSGDIIRQFMLSSSGL
jgi:hypothetical protein